MGGTVFYRFKSTTQYFSIAIPGERVRIVDFKRAIRQLYRMTRDDLRVFGKESYIEYGDHASIQSNSTVIIVRVPIPMPQPIMVFKSTDIQTINNNFI